MTQEHQVGDTVIITTVKRRRGTVVGYRLDGVWVTGGPAYLVDYDGHGSRSVWFAPHELAPISAVDRLANLVSADAQAVKSPE